MRGIFTFLTALTSLIKQLTDPKARKEIMEIVKSRYGDKALIIADRIIRQYDDVIDAYKELVDTSENYRKYKGMEGLKKISYLKNYIEDRLRAIKNLKGKYGRLLILE